VNCDLSDFLIVVTHSFICISLFRSQSVPDSVLLNKSETTTTMTHYFLVGNQGPSPYDLKVTIFVPQLEGNGSNILEIESLEVNHFTTAFT
jgi:hypothetical protein